MIKLSIITINRNNAAGLRKTIESVVSQTFTDFEYIIIDGASTDDSIEVIKEYVGIPAKLSDESYFWSSPSGGIKGGFVSEPDKGIYNAMNKGIIKANGEYLQFLNSGDWLFTNTILQSVFDLERTEDVLYGDEVLYYDDSKQIKKFFPSELTFYNFYVGSISHEGSFYKKELFKIPYNENLRIASDWEFELREIVFSNCTTFKIDNEIIYFDMSGISQSYEFKKMQVDERESILNNYLPSRVLADFKELEMLKKLTTYSLYPYVLVFSKLPTLQRTVKRFMKIVLWLSGNKHLIPKK